jgi:hypothetical protein
VTAGNGAVLDWCGAARPARRGAACEAARAFLQSS